MTPVGQRRGADLLVRLDVRVPDAVAGDARAAGSLLEQTNRLIVRRQIDYGAALGVPWGISESAYNARDLELTYQYSNFGVPGLGLKRGLGENVVDRALCDGARRHGRSRGGARELRRASPRSAGAAATASTRRSTSRRRGCRKARRVAIVRAFMAHHQGMTIVAIANALLDGVMRARFHAEPMIQATELLLQERTPRDVAVAHPRAEEVATAAAVDDLEPAGGAPPAQSPHAASPSARICCRTAATR